MPSDSLSSGILALVWNSGPIAKGVLVVLMIFSIVSWALIVEKAFQFRRVRRQTFEFLRVFREARRTSVVHTAARRLRQRPLAQLYFAAYQEVSGIPRSSTRSLDDVDEGLGPDRLEAVNRACDARPRSRSLGSSTTCRSSRPPASATPFIGLFGTVWGIMTAFHGIGAQAQASLAVVAPGISEALVATAAGLGAAIPAVIGYNYFVNRVKHWAVEMEGFTMDLLNVLSRPVAKAGRTAKDGV